jgi:hypothetical protein
MVSAARSTSKLSESASIPAVMPQLNQWEHSTNLPLSQNRSTAVCSLQHSKTFNKNRKHAKKVARNLHEICISLGQRKWNEFLRRHVEVRYWSPSAKIKKNAKPGMRLIQKVFLKTTRRGYVKYRVLKNSSLRWHVWEKTSPRGRETMDSATMNRVDDTEYSWTVPEDKNEIPASPESVEIETAKEKYERKEASRKMKDAKCNARLRLEARCLQKREERHGVFRSSPLARDSDSDAETEELPISLLEDKYLQLVRSESGSTSSPLLQHGHYGSIPGMREIREVVRIQEYTRPRRFGTFWWRHSEKSKRQMYDTLRVALGS